MFKIYLAQLFVLQTDQRERYAFQHTTANKLGEPREIGNDSLNPSLFQLSRLLLSRRGAFS